MRLRTLVLLLGLSIASHAKCTSPGKERWAIKSSIPAGASLDSGKPVALAGLARLNNPPGVTNKQKEYEAARIPAFNNPLGVKEGDLVTVTGYLFLVATEQNDCEYHIQIAVNFPNVAGAGSSHPVILDDCVIAEIARPGAFSDPKLQQAADGVRKWIREQLHLKDRKGGPEPAGDGSLMNSPVHVKISGQLFFDDAHLKKDGASQPRGKHGLHTNQLWEIHPVVAIGFAQP